MRSCCDVDRKRISTHAGFLLLCNDAEACGATNLWEFRCRAEATDVANAVLDGVDGILLGAETLRGKYPVDTVQTVLAICHQAEKVFDHNYHFEHLMQVRAR